VITSWDFASFTGGNQGAVVNYPVPGYATIDASIFSASLVATPSSKNTVQALAAGYSGTSMDFVESSKARKLGGNFILTITPAPGQILSQFSLTYYARSSIATTDAWQIALIKALLGAMLLTNRSVPRGLNTQ
jgi:hypothetical protein